MKSLLLPLLVLLTPLSALGQEAFIPPAVEVAGKSVLVCHPSQLKSCTRALPESVRAQLPSGLAAMQGYRSAMVLPLDSDEFAGLVLWAPERESFQTSAIVGGHLLQLKLDSQLWLTFWHEIGHLEVRALQGSVLPESLSIREQEWLADAFLYWHIAKQHQSLQLAWQQFDRRNLQVMNDVSHLSHWSSLYLLPLLKSYTIEDLVFFTGFKEFCQDFYPSLPRWSDADMAEFSHLISQVFGTSTTPVLPEFLFWRKPSLAPVIAPTLERLMGADAANQWLGQQHLLIKG